MAKIKPRLIIITGLVTFVILSGTIFGNEAFSQIGTIGERAKLFSELVSVCEKDATNTWEKLKCAPRLSSTVFGTPSSSSSSEQEKQKMYDEVYKKCLEDGRKQNECKIIATEVVKSSEDLKVSGSVYAGEDVSADENVNAGKDVNAAQNVNAGGDVNADNNVNAKGDVTADGDINGEGDLNVDGNANIGRDVTAHGDLNTDKDVNAKGDVNADGQITADGNISTEQNVIVDGNLDAGGQITADGDITTQSDLIARGNIDADGDAFIDGNTDIGGNLIVDGTAEIGYVCPSSGLTEFCGSIKVNQNADVLGDLTVGGTVVFTNPPSLPYAKSTQSCNLGEVVTGIADDGTLTCAIDQIAIPTTDADTLDGLDSTVFVQGSQGCSTGETVVGIGTTGQIICAADPTTASGITSFEGKLATGMSFGTISTLPVTENEVLLVYGFELRCVNKTEIGTSILVKIQQDMQVVTDSSCGLEGRIITGSITPLTISKGTVTVMHQTHQGWQMINPITNVDITLPKGQAIAAEPNIAIHDDSVLYVVNDGSLHCIDDIDNVMNNHLNQYGVILLKFLGNGIVSNDDTCDGANFNLGGGDFVYSPGDELVLFLSDVTSAVEIFRIDV